MDMIELSREQVSLLLTLLRETAQSIEDAVPDMEGETDPDTILLDAELRDDARNYRILHELIRKQVY